MPSFSALVNPVEAALPPPREVPLVGDDIAAPPDGPDPPFNDIPEETLAGLQATCSASNFAVKLCGRLYTPNELLNRTTLGTKDRRAIAKNRLDYIEIQTKMRYFANQNPIEKDKNWNDCRRSIDAKLRRYHRAQ